MDEAARELVRIMVPESSPLAIAAAEELLARILSHPDVVLRALGGRLAGLDRRMRDERTGSSWLFPFGAELYDQ